jgi:hypothetical protein
MLDADERLREKRERVTTENFTAAARRRRGCRLESVWAGKLMNTPPPSIIN